MARRTVKTTLLLLFCVALLGGQASAAPARATLTLRALEHADPQRDLAAALARGDTRFIGVYGFSREVPGLGSPHALLALRHGVHYVRDSSDTGEPRLNRLARRYAEHYNRLLLEHLRRRYRHA